MSAGQNKSAKLEGAGGEWEKISISKVTDTIDYVANGSFESLRNNVTYKDSPDYAILIRLVDYNAGWRGRFVYVDKISYDFLRKSALVPGDIIIANVGANAGTVFRVPELNTHMTLGPNAVLCRPKNENILQKKFLYYYLVSSDGQNLLQTILSGSAQPKFNKTDFRSLLIPIPPLEDQRAIAHILGTLDDKIELNRRTNETLEAMAQALFKFWFVDFGPVRAKMEGRWRRGQSLSGLPAHLFDLFPDRLVDSELGEIPEGWEVGKLGDLAKIASGKRPPLQSLEYQTNFKISLWGGNGPMAFVKEPLFQCPILLTGRVGTLGSVFRIKTPCWPSDNTLIVITHNDITYEFLYFQMKLINYKSLNRGSTQPLLTQSDLKNQVLILPSKNILQYFHIIINNIFLYMDNFDNISHTLATIRDTLLPKLISGELRVKDAEKIIGR